MNTHKGRGTNTEAIGKNKGVQGAAEKVMVSI